MPIDRRVHKFILIYSIQNRLFWLWQFSSVLRYQRILQGQIYCLCSILITPFLILTHGIIFMTQTTG